MSVRNLDFLALLDEGCSAATSRNGLDCRHDDGYEIMFYAVIVKNKVREGIIQGTLYQVNGIHIPLMVTRIRRVMEGQIG